jgi:cytoskeleton protein RodZ
MLLSDSSGNERTPHPRTRDSDSAGLGELLRCAREHRGLTLAQISNETKIPQRHLEALEHDNLAAVPGGFYRRAEIRAYARAVHLDQNLALARLERALKPSGAREGVLEIPRTEKPTFSRKRVLTVIGVVVAAAVFGRVMGGRESALDPEAQLRRATDAPLRRAPLVLETPTDAAVGPSQPTQLDPVAPRSAPTEGSSNAGLPVTTAGADARVSADSVTELVVTTEPPGTRVTVNGIGWGTAPVTIRYLPPGDKRIRVSKEGYATEERLVHLVEGHPRTLDIRLRSAP